MTLDSLVRAAEQADGMTRIGYRDEIAVMGAPAIERMTSWLHDERLGRFAARVIAAAAGQPDCLALAVSTLRRAIPGAPEGIGQDIEAILATLAPTGRRRTASGNGSTDQALAQLRDVVGRWRRNGARPQPGIPWPRERWLRDLPAHRRLLERLPAILDRAAVASVARHAAETEEAALEALVAVMAWGHGSRGYAQSRAVDILAQPRVGRRLRLVAEALEQRGALAGYDRLAGESRIEGLGPSFGTKFLYFAQVPAARPRALIHDRIMGDWMVDVAGLPLRSDPYNLNRYDGYLRQMHAWAQELGCAPDGAEMAIFRAIQPPGSLWGE